MVTDAGSHPHSHSPTFDISHPCQQFIWLFWGRAAPHSTFPCSHASPILLHECLGYRVSTWFLSCIRTHLCWPGMVWEHNLPLQCLGKQNFKGCNRWQQLLKGWKEAAAYNLCLRKSWELGSPTAEEKCSGECMVGSLCVVPGHRTWEWKALEKGYGKTLTPSCTHLETTLPSLVGRQSFFRSNICVIPSSPFRTLSTSSVTSWPMWVTICTLALCVIFLLHLVAVSPSFSPSRFP